MTLPLSIERRFTESSRRSGEVAEASTQAHRLTSMAAESSLLVPAGAGSMVHLTSRCRRHSFTNSLICRTLHSNRHGISPSFLSFTVEFLSGLWLRRQRGRSEQARLWFSGSSARWSYIQNISTTRLSGPVVMCALNTITSASHSVCIKSAPTTPSASLPPNSG